MGKRFTSTEKWDDPWFRKLPVQYKALWQFICDKCDNAGVWKKDFESAIYFIGEKVEEKIALELFNHEKERVKPMNGDLWLIAEFVPFQFGELSDKSRVHLSVINLIAKHQKKGYGKGMDTLSARVKEKDKDKDKEKEQEKDKDKDKEKDTVKYLELWNSKMPWKLNDITHKRYIHLKERLKEPAFVDNFPALLDKILASDFLTGRRPSDTHPNFKADFDWLISNDTNHVKVMEGKYDNKEKTGLSKFEVRR